MPLIPIAIALAQFVPSLMQLFGANEPSVEIAAKVVGIAQNVTNTTTPEDALAAVTKDLDMRREFSAKVMDQQHEISLAILQDVKDARARDIAIWQAGKRNVRADAMSILAVVVTLIMVYIVWKDASINEYVKGIFTLVLGRFLGYLDSIYNFEFGRTRASQDKDTTIANLSRGS